MNTRLYVGNLPYSMTSDQLKAMFAEFGEVTDAKIISDRQTGRSKGFGFVEFANADDAQKAIEALHEKDIEGRKIIVNVARPMQPRQPRPY